MSAVKNRYDFVYFFDVSNGNPNGDPDAGNLPRQDPETSQGLVSDVCLKRKVRNYVAIAACDAPGRDIYVVERAILNVQHMKAWEAVMPATKEAERGKLPRDEAKARALTDWMCANFYDVRGFGAVMSTGVNCGQVRGPLQFSFARSIDPILPLDLSITRMAATTVADAQSKGDVRTMGRKQIVPYGLYRAHGYVSAMLAAKTGFSEEDLAIFWDALGNMFDHDHSASRGDMAARGLKVFRHDSALGSAPAHRLFDRVGVRRAYKGKKYAIGSDRADTLPPPRCFSDYAIHVDQANLPRGVTFLDLI